MQSGTKKLAIVIITYNCHNVFLKQIERIARHCKDKYDLIVIDNSTNEKSVMAITHYCDKIRESGELVVMRHKVIASSVNSSASHSFAANYSQTLYGESYDYFLYLDHDCFPVKDFSVIDLLGAKAMAGVGQAKIKKTYLWPGCLMFKKNSSIDFSPNHELGLDTGGNLYKAMELSGDNVIYFDEIHKQNPEFTKGFYNFYSLINDGMFMHFVNGSNWNNREHHEERINSLLNILDQQP